MPRGSTHNPSTAGLLAILINNYEYLQALISTIMHDLHLCHSQEVCSEDLVSPQQCQEAAHRGTEGEYSRNGQFDYVDFQEDPHRVQLSAALQDDVGVVAWNEECDSCALILLNIAADDLFVWDAKSCVEDSSLQAVAIFTCKATESF